MPNSPTAIKTATGRFFDPIEPDPADIDIAAAARALAIKARFGCHTAFPWSVAAHSLLVAAEVDPSLQLAALIHDVGEAFSGFGDVLTPVKRSGYLDGLLVIEGAIERAACRRFGVDPERLHHPAIKAIDRVACWAEALRLQPGGFSDWWPERQPGPEHTVAIHRLALRVVERPWREVEAEFLAKFEEYGGEVDGGR